MEHQTPTHILVSYKSQNYDLLFRADSGICIGQRKNFTVVFGAEPNKRRSHVFIDGDSAQAYLRNRVAADDLSEQCKSDIGVAIEERDGEGTIILPPDSVDFDLPLPGKRMPLKN